MFQVDDVIMRENGYVMPPLDIIIGHQWRVVVSLMIYQRCDVISTAADCDLRHMKMAKLKYSKVSYNLEHSKIFYKTYNS